MKGSLALACLIALFLAASAASAPLPLTIPTSTVSTAEPSHIAAAFTPTVVEALPTEAPSPMPTASSDCAEADATRMGDSIASSYSFTSTTEVLGWFCAGTDFEDILTALETEDMTAIPAEDTLQMRSDGLNWEEIWQVTGLYDR